MMRQQQQQPQQQRLLVVDRGAAGADADVAADRADGADTFLPCWLAVSVFRAMIVTYLAGSANPVRATYRLTF